MEGRDRQDLTCALIGRAPKLLRSHWSRAPGLTRDKTALTPLQCWIYSSSPSLLRHWAVSSMNTKITFLSSSHSAWLGWLSHHNNPQKLSAKCLSYKNVSFNKFRQTVFLSSRKKMTPCFRELESLVAELPQIIFPSPERLYAAKLFTYFIIGKSSNDIEVSDISGYIISTIKSQLSSLLWHKKNYKNLIFLS